MEEMWIERIDHRKELLGGEGRGGATDHRKVNLLSCLSISIGKRNVLIFGRLQL